MSRIRTIKPEFWISEQVMSCSHSARLLFIGLWNFCDDGGIHAANIRKLKAEVFPGDEATLIDVDGWMKELIKQRLVVEFTAQYNGESCNFWFVTGWKHQRIDKPYLKYPPYQAQQASAITPRPFDDHSQHVPRIVEEYSAQGVEGKGVEGKGVEEEAAQAPFASPPMPPLSPVIPITATDTATEATTPAPKVAKAPKPAKPLKAPIPADWTPADSTLALLERSGICRDYAERCVEEFRLYWQERGESRPGWEASFVNNVKRQWERRPPPTPPTPTRNGARYEQPPPQRQMTPEVAEFDAILRNLNAQNLQPVIEGECSHVAH